ncbi:MAG TPA: hypothetical protein PKD03_04195 [Ignavibacteriaceae bacterium]|nr:hypothetical protein [Ignavibacteriaceae bacterium]
MDYITWNNLIASHFFNEEMEEKEVYLYITKSEIMEIGASILIGKSGEEIWEDFVKALKAGLDGKVDDSDILKTLFWVYDYYKSIKKLNPEKFPYPPYLAYLIVFIIPLTEEMQLNINSYYLRTNKFLIDNNLPILKPQNSNFNWNKIWEDLEYWSIYERNFEIGYFEIHDFINPNWVYVSKPLSQSFIKPSSVKRLPSLFFQNNILPNQNISNERIRQFLINCSRNIDINENLLIAIKKNDEIGQLLINIVKKFYEKWNGEEITYSKKDIEAGVRQPWVLSVIKLGIELNYSEEKINFFLRLFSNNEFPEELIFSNSIKVEFERKNWSNKLNFNVADLIQKQSDLILEDLNNKWRGIFNYKNLFFFTSGTNHSLNGWIESEIITPGEEVFIICNEVGKQSLLDYFKDEWLNYLQVLDFEGLNYHYLYKLKNSIPTIFFEKFNIGIQSNQLLQFNNILKINQRDFLLDINPTVTLKNFPPGEPVILKYTDYDEEIILDEKIDFFTYKLPKQIKLDSNIEIGLKNRCIRFIKPFINNKYFLEIQFRNSWSEITNNTTEFYWQGNDLQKTISNNILYNQSIHHFKSELNPSIPKDTKLDYRCRTSYNKSKDIMLSFLSSSGKISFEKYFTAFEQILFTHGSIGVLNNFNYSKFLSLRYLESLGHIDIDYLNQKIFINKPKIILIPNNSFIGRKAILLGARSPEFVLNLIKKSSDLKIKVVIEDSISIETGLQYIIPQVVHLFAQGDNNDRFGEKRILILAEHLKIDLYPQLIQPLFLITSSKIDDYETKLIEDNCNDYEWARQIFNPFKMKFELSPDEFNKELCLLKYHFTNYHIRFRLWLDGNCYIDSNNKNEGIDPLWGRYFIFYKLKKNVLLFDEINRSLLVPNTTPLPRYINKALTLMSGYIPQQKEHNGIIYDVYSNLIPSLTKNIFVQLGQILK